MVAELEKKGATIHVKARCECRYGDHFRTFLESFSLFGTSLDDYDKLFEEKLGLFMQLQEKDVVHWHGECRSPLNDEHKGLPL